MPDITDNHILNLSDEAIRQLADIALLFNMTPEDALHLAIRVTHDGALKFKLGGNSKLTPTGLLNQEEDHA